MKVQLSRWPMCGGGIAYAVRVPVDEAPAFLRDRTPKGSNSYVTQIGGHNCNGRYFFDFVNVTTEQHHDMEPGSDKWEDWKAHEKQARARMLTLLQSAFPETKQLTEYPTLWVTGLLPKEKERNCAKTVWVEA